MDGIVIFVGIVIVVLFSNIVRLVATGVISGRAANKIFGTLVVIIAVVAYLGSSNGAV